MDASEAWCLKGRIMPFGKGSRRLAVAMGVEFLKPDKIFVDGAWHANPYIVCKDGKAVGVYYVKHGIAIAPEGIRYLQPYLDFVDLTAVIGATAMNTMDVVHKTSQDGAKNCTKTVFEKMQAAWTKPGDPDWFFVPTLDENTGIAFNQNEKGDAGDAIRKLQSDILMLKRNPLRKIDTATDRLVFEKLFPEALTAFDEKSVVMCDNYGKTNSDPKYLKNVKAVTFKVKVPTKAPIARAALTEFGIALRDSDPASRERKFGDVVRMFGGMVQVKELASGPLEPEQIDPENASTGTSSQFEITDVLTPIPVNMGLRDFKLWMKDEYHKLTPAQKNTLFEASGSTDSTKSIQITKENWRGMYQFMMDFAGIAPEAKEPEPTPDDMRAHMMDWIAEHDGKMGVLAEILGEEGLPEDTDLNLIPDAQIVTIYGYFITHLKDQKQEHN